MKKLMIIFLLSSIYINAQFNTIWEKSASLNNLPSWFSASDTRERGFAVSYNNGSPRVYVISNKADPTVIILNAFTGDSVGTLNTTGISGGLIPLNDISTLGYGGISPIYACNLTDNAQVNPFKIYRWENENSTPELIITDDTLPLRLGDHFSSIVFFPYRIIAAASNTNKIIDYSSSNGNPPFFRKVVILSDGVIANNASADYNWIYPTSYGGYVVNSDGHRPKFYDTTGVFLGESSDTIISAENNSIKFFANGSLCCDAPFYTTYQYGINNAALVLSAGYTDYEFHWGETPSLGSNPNPENFGDVEYYWSDNTHLYIYVLAGNNGIGAYLTPGLTLPVELTSFNAEKSGTEIILNWQTATETNNQGFEVQRKASVGDFVAIGFIEGKGTSTEQQNYSFTDKSLSEGKYSYRLKQNDYDGSFEYSKIIEVEIHNSLEFSLSQNYPNPFNPSTKISWQSPVGSWQTLKVYDVLGNLITTLIDEYKPAGSYEVEFKATFGSHHLADGIYFYQLKAGSFVETKKMILLK